MSLAAPSSIVPRRRRHLSWVSFSALAAALGLACSASDEGRGPTRIGVDGNEGGDFFEPGTGGGGTTPTGQTGDMGLVDDQPMGSGRVDIDDACVVDTAEAMLVEQPVDIILLADNSGSMDQEIQAVEDNINRNFAEILISSGVDYRVIIITRHRVEPRTASESASTSLCVTTPLSGLTNCDAAPQPVFSERFFQFNTKVESTDSFDVAIDTYAQPIASDYQEDDEDDMPLAPLGWSAWLRPRAKKVFLELTDDNEDMAAAEFVRQLIALPEGASHFGPDPLNPSFVFHSIVGLAEKTVLTDAYLPSEPIQVEECTTNGGDVTSAGLTYQELSILTGGLRFPLCQFSGFDVVFQRIATDVVNTSAIACDFPIPAAPQGSVLDLEKVAIEYTPSNGSPSIQFGQAPAYGVCQSDAFYIANDRLNLCPEACTTIRSDPTASVAVLFTCESQIIVPR
jgi:hypothetical protein